MKRLLYWLIAILVLLALVWLLYAWMVSRMSYQPDWYRSGEGAALNDPEYAGSDGTAGEAEAVKSGARDGARSGEGAQLPPLPADTDAAGAVEADRDPASAASRSGRDRSARAGASEYSTAGGTERSTADRPYDSAVAGAERSASGGAQSSAASGANRSAASGRVSAEVRPRSAAVAATPLQRELEEKGIARVSEADLIPVMLREMRGSDPFDPRSVILGAKSTITPERLVIEMMVDLTKFPDARLGPQGAAVFKKVKGMLPEKTLSELYVKGDVRPLIAGEQVLMASGSSLGIGKFTFNAAEIQEKFGVQPRIDLNHFAFRKFRLGQGYIELIK